MHAAARLRTVIAPESRRFPMTLLSELRRLLPSIDDRQRFAATAHAARVALVGELMQSIAHDLAQPLTAILSNVEAAELMLRRRDPDVGPIREILADVRRDDLRANCIVNRLNALLLRREVRFERVDVNALVDDAVSLLHANAIRRRIVLHSSLADDLPITAADPIYLQQAILSLIVDAMDALQEVPRSERRVGISTKLERGASIEVTISSCSRYDTFEHAASELETLTTEHDDVALRRSIVSSIVRQHGGRIWTEDLHPRGTAFRIALPAKVA